MRVRLVKKKTIEKYAAAHASSKSAFKNWLTKVKTSDWHTPEDIKTTFGSADLLGGGNRVVFDIAGNNYRMICKYWFGETKVHFYIKWIGTHNEYDEVCKAKKQYTISDY